MLILGAEHIAPLLDGERHAAKMIFNADGAIIFPVTREHRDMTAAGLSYEDNYKGNALAAMLAPGRIEIRFHQGFTDADVARTMRQLLSTRECAGMSEWSVTYQGRSVHHKACD